MADRRRRAKARFHKILSGLEDIYPNKAAAAMQATGKRTRIVGLPTSSPHMKGTGEEHHG
jgi:hypothetical protein